MSKFTDRLTLVIHEAVRKDTPAVDTEFGMSAKFGYKPASYNRAEVMCTFGYEAVIKRDDKERFIQNCVDRISEAVYSDFRSDLIILERLILEDKREEALNKAREIFNNTKE